MIDAFRRFHQGRPALARAAVLLASGALAGSCYWPEGLGWPMWFALVPLVWALEGATASQGFLRGWLWGLAGWGVAMHWFVRVTLEYAAGPWAWRLLLALGVIAYHGLMLALPAGAAAWTAARLEGRGWDRRAALAAAFTVWTVAAEGLFPQVYPACVAATQLGHLPAVQSLELWGAGGVSLLIMGVNAALYAAWRLPAPRARRAVLAAAAAALVANEGYGRWRMAAVAAAEDAARAAGRTLRLAVVQGDIPLAARNTGASADANIAFYSGLTARAAAEGPELVVWPHNTYERTLLYGPGDPALERPRLAEGPLEARLAADVPSQAHVLLSAQAESPETAREPGPSRHYVTVLKGPRGAFLGATAKVNPTPLAEMMPLGSWFPVLYRLTPKLKRLVPGPSRLLTMSDGRRLGVFICYDAVKTGPARALAAAGAQVLVNPSSDQWSYDKTAQPWQHLRIVALRAVENRRWFARATPSGLSVIVDAAGRVVRELSLDAAGAAVETVPLLEGRTPFMALGDAAYWAALAGALALAALGRAPRGAI